MKYLVIILLLASSAFAAPRHSPETFTATILSVSDGDTFYVTHGKQPEKVRLHYADAPEVKHRPTETDQPHGQEALDYVAKNWKGKTLTFTVRGKSYGREVVDVVDAKGNSLAVDLVSRGLAEVDPRFHPPKSLRDAQEKAKSDKLGVWSDAEHIAPWDWRKQQRVKPK